MLDELNDGLNLVVISKATGKSVLSVFMSICGAVLISCIIAAANGILIVLLLPKTDPAIMMLIFSFLALAELIAFLVIRISKKPANPDTQ